VAGRITAVVLVCRLTPSELAL